MELRKKWLEQSKKSTLWQPEDRLLLAVSGGVDSVVLLDLFLHLPKAIRPFFGVAHVDHQLREQSKKEKEWLQIFCQNAGLPFYCVEWSEGNVDGHNIENRARLFRYQFFETVMQENGYQKLVTAHHADDQTETILMRLTKGAQIKALAGIQEKRLFGTGELIRPLLSFTKQELMTYAKKYQLVYFEDETNYQMDYFRNQLRWKVLPVMQKENPEISRQMQSFSKKMNYATTFISEKISESSVEVFQKYETNHWQLLVDRFQQKTEVEQYFLLVYWFEQIKELFSLSINEKQLEQILSILRQQDPQKSVRLNQDWQFVRQYDIASIEPMSQTVNDSFLAEEHLLIPDEDIWLSDNQRLVLFDSRKVPDVVKRKAVYIADFWLSSEQLPLVIRKVQSGDRLLMSNGHHKKINRLFIDLKLTDLERKKAWIVTTKSGEILCCLPYRCSHLSIKEETDKIHYRLVYYEK